MTESTKEYTQKQAQALRDIARTRGWKECSFNGCVGAVQRDGLCLLHLGALERKRVLADAPDRIDCRGIRVTQTFVRELREALPETGVWTGLTLDGGKLESRVSFKGDTFRGRTSFVAVEAKDEVVFDDAVFDGRADLGGATFMAACFKRVRFRRALSLLGTRFVQKVDFHHAVFETTAFFSATEFCTAPEPASYASFAHVTFVRDATLMHVWFGSNAYFRDAIAVGQLFLSDVTFAKDAIFGGVRVTGGCTFSGVSVGGTLAFDNASLHSIAEPDRRLAEFVEALAFDNVKVETVGRFVQTRFERPVRFRSCRFRRGATYGRACFRDRAIFRNTDFPGGVQFDDAEFCGAAAFSFVDLESLEGLTRLAAPETCDFGPDTTFERTEFHKGAVFRGAAFSSVSFAGAQFRGATTFERAHFADVARFNGRPAEDDSADLSPARFGSVSFKEAVFNAPPRFDGVTVTSATFTYATFSEAMELGPIAAGSLLDLTGCKFGGDVTLEAVANDIRCRAVAFAGQVSVRARWAEISLERVSFTSPAVIAAAARPFEGLGETEERVAAKAAEAGETNARPRIVSLRDANLESLTLSTVDLSACAFLGARNLDKLRLEGDIGFARSPYLRTLRRSIAEEHAWRAGDGADAPKTEGPAKRRPWSWPSRESVIRTDVAPVIDPPGPAQLEAIYRGLRKAFEDSKNEPAAGDFYYGEMEMRRQALRERARSEGRVRYPVERALLAAYWLVAGYALRALRPLAFLLLLLALGSWLLYWEGFVNDVSLGRSIRFSVETATSFLRSPRNTDPLSALGFSTEIIMRIAGPALVAVTVLALRARVKR